MPWHLRATVLSKPHGLPTLSCYLQAWDADLHGLVARLERVLAVLSLDIAAARTLTA